jgi:exopolysaccharide biosynthesis polyprenyl glycosylphosphotransferase
VIVGAGDVGQLVARKLRQHPEYGIDLLGFVDAAPREMRGDLDGVQVLGPTERLLDLARRRDVERVIVAFSSENDGTLATLIGALKALDVQIDVVPRLFDVVGPNVAVHSVEGLPLVGLPASKLFPFSRSLKRALDLVAASLLLVLVAPLFAYIALRVKLDSPGPVFFRQKRLGLHMREFEALKFRTMYVGVDQDAHREYIASTMTTAALPNENGLYKLERSNDVTRFGRGLRRTSLDELPNLVNVLRGEMSLVGPRPCLQYETDLFEPHHFERFLVPAGLTGLWQVTARAHSTFREALDLDVTYARNWSLGLDLMLLLKTPFALTGRSGTR